ncbi:MAG: WYL domain-containing protein [Ruminococcaceae bacterium]|nr:WYL domain-containing protein [Oscillospiraceae bacterium]
MANSDLSKLKILFIYDYFKRELDAFDDNNGVSVNELIAYLEEKLGYVFERKSIYADISRINEYVSKTCEVDGADSWISVEGKKYHKNQIRGEISVDEARLLVDAINTTEFVDSNLNKKIIEMFPKYFDENYRSRALVPHDSKMSQRKIIWLNIIRGAIERKECLKITYGYKLGNELAEKSEKSISPMALDWRNSCYYIIAIDNVAAAKLLKEGKSIESALKHYRYDRVANVDFDLKQKYVDFPTKRAHEAAIKRFIEVSVSSYSGGIPIALPLTIMGENRKMVLQAYNAFASRIGQVPNIDDTKLDKGRLDLIFKTTDVPTLYTGLFELATFEGISIGIGNETVRQKYAEYLKRATGGLSEIAKD